MIATHDRVRTEQRKLSACSAPDAVMSATDGVNQGQRFQSFGIAHELLHLRVPTHGRRFKALTSAHVPGWREFEEQWGTSRPIRGGARGQ